MFNNPSMLLIGFWTYTLEHTSLFIDIQKKIFTRAHSSKNGGLDGDLVLKLKMQSCMEKQRGTILFSQFLFENYAIRDIFPKSEMQSRIRSSLYPSQCEKWSPRLSHTTNLIFFSKQPKPHGQDRWLLRVIVSPWRWNHSSSYVNF